MDRLPPLFETPPESGPSVRSRSETLSPEDAQARWKNPSIPPPDAPAAKPHPARRPEAKGNPSSKAPVIGRVDFDAEDPTNSNSRVVVSESGRKHFHRNLYVGIRDKAQGVDFLGRIVSGPFHEPKEGADYLVYGIIEVLGQLTEGERLLPTTTRPRPDAVVYVFPDSRLRAFLQIEGDIYLGHLSGHTSVEVNAASDNKNFFPRNVGVFGTVGSGKSNTSQVLIEEAIEAGWAVVVVDVEGEYVRMNEPTDDQKLIEILQNQVQRTVSLQRMRVVARRVGCAATMP